MADTNVPVPTGGAVTMNAAPQMLAPNWRAMLSGFTGQPALRRAMPALVGVGAVGIVAALYMTIAQGPQRVLYTSLTDSERAQVTATLDTGGITYAIDNSTGAVRVAEDDVYRARMLVASDAGLAAPAGASEMLDAIPLGSSRTLEGERLRLARERELMLTIREIDGIESVRVHLATPERSVFVRQNSAPTASVMVRLAGGRSLNQSQVEAIVNLVSGSVPGMTSDSVRVVDQNGRLLSSEHDETMDALLLQREFEGKLREQLTTLLMPLLGDGNFSSQVQVTLDQSEITSARESYDQEGAVRSESERNSTRSAGAGTGGIPGVTANTPPAAAQLVDAVPDPAAAPADGAVNVAATGDSESAVQRNYELGREVAVTSTRPGGLVKLSVAVAVSDAALKAAAPLTAEKLQSLIGAAVGADTARGDQVQVVVSTFESTEMPEMAFYEQPWFAAILRYSAALIAVLLVLLLAVRPLIARMRGGSAKSGEDTAGEGRALTDQSEGQSAAASFSPDQVDLPQRVELARQLAKSQPDRAVEALQRMLENPADLAQRVS
ncbi:flagellar basal-body MS-ring/collar protein FliF [Qipengyuania sp. ASV99]|uniref:flagellar basal-body MS-ring/collar protein FliF n=1 Tax=Qipengyuania sp. ASV99 TaxID=3399681 RepID=UPI003A4C7E42